MMLLEQVQNQLESIYGILLPQRAEDYLISKGEALKYLNETPNSKIPKELLLVKQPGDDTVEIALFLDKKLLNNLSKNNPLESLNEKNLSDFCILIEGVSHFVYFLWKAHNQHAITQLELELQAEIDKFLMLLFYLRGNGSPVFPQDLFENLFEDFKLIENLSIEKKERYMTASTLAMRYCQKLRDKYKGEIFKFLSEIRQFYNFSQEQKIKHIIH